MAKSRHLPVSTRNQLLARLAPKEHERFLSRLRPVPLLFNQVLGKVGTPMDYAYFPNSGVMSALTVMQNGDLIEVGTIGNEGMAATTAFIGNHSSPHKLIVQVAGEGFRIPTKELAEELTDESPLRHLLLQHHLAFHFTISQSVACNGLHSISQRCCRWLLMTHDRVDGDEMTMTHEFLAIMLGVRRASVTLVLQPFQDRKMIKYTRGKITVLDRAGLEITCCECYQTVKDAYARLLG